MARRVTRLIPAAYREGSGGVRSLGKLFLWAVGLRLALMPLSCHGDLISTYHRAYLLLTEGDLRFAVPQEILQAVMLALAGWTLKLDQLLLWAGDSHTAPREFWLQQFAPHPQALWALFVFKVPYLVCDLAAALVLLQLFRSEPEKGLRAVKIWLFNPLTLFVFYVFGRHEAVSILFLLLTLLWLQRQRPLLAGLSLGTAIWSRYYGLLFLPFLPLALAGSRRSKAVAVGVGLAPVLLFNLVTKLTSPDEPARLLSMAESKFALRLTAARWELGWRDELYLFPLLYGILVLAAWFRGRWRPGAAGFAAWSAAAVLILFATSLVHPQYFAWAVPLLVVCIAEEGDRRLLRLLGLLMLLIVPYTFYWKRPLFGFLFAPLKPEVFLSLPSPWEWIATWYPPEVAVGVARSLLSAVCLFMVLWLLRERLGSGGAETD